MTKPQHLLVLTMAPRGDQWLAVCASRHDTDRHSLGCAQRLYIVTGLPTLLLIRILLETMLVTADTRQLVFSPCENHTQGASLVTIPPTEQEQPEDLSQVRARLTPKADLAPYRPGCRVFFEGGVLEVICTSSTSRSAASKGAQILAVGPFPAPLFPFPTWSEAMLFCFSH